MELFQSKFQPLSQSLFCLNTMHKGDHDVSIFNRYQTMPRHITLHATLLIISAFSFSCITLKVTTFKVPQNQSGFGRNEIIQIVNSIFLDELGFTGGTITWTSKTYINPDATYTKTLKFGTTTADLKILNKEIFVVYRSPSTLSGDPESIRMRETLIQRLTESFGRDIELSEDNLLKIFTAP